MSAAREDVLREAESWAVRLRRAGYTEVAVAPEYCIGNEINGGFFTRTISVYVGPRAVEPKRLSFLARIKLWWSA
jgi:hypothetical protein